VSGHVRWGVAGLAAALVAAAAGFVPALLARPLIDDAILAGSPGLLAPVLAGVAAAGLASIAAGALSHYALARFSGEAVTVLQRDLLERTLALPWRFFGLHQPGYLMSRIVDDAQGMGWFLTGAPVMLAASLFRLAAGAVILFSLEWRLAAGTLPFLVLMGLLAKRMSGVTRNLDLHAMEEGARVSARLEEAVSSPLLARTSDPSGLLAGRFRTGLRGLLGLGLERTAAAGAAGAGLELVSGLARLAALAAGSLLIVEGRWTPGSLVSFLAILGTVTGPARLLAAGMLQAQQALASTERVSALLRAGAGGSGGRQVERISRVTFRGVSFSWVPGSPVLQGADLDLSAGCRLAVTGASGAGKSTLLLLLAGLLEPDAGEILFDGTPARSLDGDSLRARMAFVPQDPPVISGTVLENIRMARPGASAESAAEACRLAALECPLDLELGPGGAGLSQGQKQRLALARALVRDADLIILDEPTSMLDGISEAAAARGILEASAGRILVLVTHSPALLGMSDRVMDLSGAGNSRVSGR
jgi:ABC-type multidrug transport system fused ATPase/permease subunit